MQSQDLPWSWSASAVRGRKLYLLVLYYKVFVLGRDKSRDSVQYDMSSVYLELSLI